MPTKFAKHLLSIFFLVLFLCTVEGQVSINTPGAPPDSSAMLDITSSSKGLLIPRISMVERNAISGPAHSLLIYQNDGVAGYYYNNGTPALPQWTPLAGGAGEVNSRIPIDTIPFTISSSGSYYLTQSFSGSGPNDGITITSSNVTIDLNGFSLTGDGTGGLDGIVSTGAIEMIRIYNGFIDNWGGFGITLSSASKCVISYVSTNNCGFAGVSMGINSETFQVKASGNSFDGITVGNGSTVSHCQTSSNSNDGIDVGSNCKIISSSATGNGDNGFETDSGCSIESSLADNNGGNGFFIGTGSSARQCISTNNTSSGFELNTASSAYYCQARFNTANGFQVEDDVFALNNTADNNTLSGFLIIGADARIDGNHSTDNSQHGFSITGTGNLLTRNSSTGNASLSFNIGAGNTAGTVLTTATFNSNTNPFANISF